MTGGGKDCAVSDHRVRAVGFGKIDAGAKSIGNAGNDAVGIMYYQGASRDRVEWEVL